jgi:hypothetical protein
VQLIA